MIPPTPGFAFRLLARDGQARRGILSTPHGEVETPTFMPVGTQGSVKTLTPREVASTGARIVLGNTYHLMLRPGAEAIAIAMVAPLGSKVKSTRGSPACPSGSTKRRKQRDPACTKIVRGPDRWRPVRGLGVTIKLTS